MSHADFNQYISYFEAISRNLIAIGHTSTNKHFFRLEFDEVLTALPSKMNWPCLVLESYDISFIDNRGDNILKQRNGAFIILERVKNSQDFDAIHAAYDKCEVIVDDILSQMMLDKRSRSHAVVKDLDLSQVQVIPIANDVDGAFGFRCSFPMINTHDIAVDPTKWLNP